MTIIYTLLGVPYVAVLDPVRGIVLQKAARKRIPSPGQMSLFAGNEPKEGDTKVENGVTYRLNQNSRWERADKAKGTTKAKPKAVVPVVEEKREEPTPEPTPVAAEPNFEVVSDRASQPPGTIFYDDPGVTPEQRAWMEYGGQNYIPATIASRTEIDNTFPDVAQAAAKARKYGYQGADDYEVLARYMAGGAARNVGSQNVYPVYFEDEPTPVAAEPAEAEVGPKAPSKKSDIRTLMDLIEVRHLYTEPTEVNKDALDKMPVVRDYLMGAGLITIQNDNAFLMPGSETPLPSFVVKDFPDIAQTDKEAMIHAQEKTKELAEEADQRQKQKEARNRHQVEKGEKFGDFYQSIIDAANAAIRDGNNVYSATNARHTQLYEGALELGPNRSSIRFKGDTLTDEQVRGIFLQVQDYRDESVPIPAGDLVFDSLAPQPTPVAAEPAKAEVRPITEIGDDFIDSPPPHDPEFRKTHGPIKRSDISYIGQDPKTGLYRIMVSGEQYTFEAVPGSGKNFRHLDGDNKIVARNYKTFRNKLGISGGSSAASALINAIKPSFSASTSEPTPVAAEVVVDEPKPKQRLGDRMRAIAQELRQETEAQKQYTARMLGAAAQLAQNQDNLIDEVVDMVNEDLDTPEALPEPTIGDMLAEQKAEEEAGGMEKIVNEDTGKDTGYTYDPKFIEVRDGYRVTCRECNHWISSSELQRTIKHSIHCVNEPQPVPPPPTPKPKPVKKNKLAEVAEAHRKGANVDPDDIYEAYRAGHLSASEAMNSDF